MKEDIEKWYHRPLSKRYSVLYLDGLYVELRRDTVEKEVFYVVLGVNEEGYREILDFFVGGQESAYVFNTSTKEASRKCFWASSMAFWGWKKPFKAVYPKADVQHCVVHKVRNTLSRVRK